MRVHSSNFLRYSSVLSVPHLGALCVQRRFLNSLLSCERFGLTVIPARRQAGESKNLPAMVGLDLLALEAAGGIAVVMAHDKDADGVAMNQVEEVIGKAGEVCPTQITFDRMKPR